MLTNALTKTTTTQGVQCASTSSVSAILGAWRIPLTFLRQASLPSHLSVALELSQPSFSLLSPTPCASRPPQTPSTHPTC